MSQHYQLQKQHYIGGYSLQNNANTALNSTTNWTINIASNCSIIRIYSSNSAFSKYMGNANNSVYDYFIPANSFVDIYNFPVANSMSFIAESGNCSIKVSQY